MLAPTTRTEAIGQLRAENPWISPSCAETLSSVFPLVTWPILLDNLQRGNLSDLNQVSAQYVTSWDNGETVITSDCTVNLNTCDVTITGERSIESANPDITCDNVDDAVEYLDKAYIILFGIEFPACERTDKENTEAYAFYYDA